MGQSTDGEIHFGIVFDEDFEFPWDADRWDGEMEDWWFKGVCGWQPSFELYDAAGEYLNGVKPPQEDFERYYTEKREFEEAHPLPVKLVNYCSGDYPMYMLAVPPGLTCHRGTPVRFDPALLYVPHADIDALKGFCATHGIDTKNTLGPAWFLTSFWG